MPPEIDRAAFDAAFNQAYDATGEESPPASAETPDISPGNTEQASTPYEGQSEETLKVPDDPEELKKGYLRQADYTRKTQEIAEQRRQLQGLDPEFLSQAQLYQQAIQQDPRLALSLLEQQADQIRSVLGEGQGRGQGYPAGAEPPSADPALPTDWTENEHYLWQQNQALQARLQQLEQGYEAVQRQSFETRAQAELRQIKEEFGVELQGFDALKLQQEAIGRGMSLHELYVSKNYKRLVEDAARKARDEAAQVVARKAAAAPPGTGLQARASPSEAAAISSIDDAIAYAMRRHGVT